MSKPICEVVHATVERIGCKVALDVLLHDNAAFRFVLSHEQAQEIGKMLNVEGCAVKYEVDYHAKYGMR